MSYISLVRGNTANTNLSGYTGSVVQGVNTNNTTYTGTVNLTSISLPAGFWYVVATFNVNEQISGIANPVGISTSSAAFDSVMNTQTNVFSFINRYLRLTTTTTVYLVGTSNGSNRPLSTLTAFCIA